VAATESDRVAELEAEVAQLRKALADLAASHRAHADREQAERERKEARRRVNRQNYERRKAKVTTQTSESDRIQTLNPPPLDGSPLPSAPSLPSPLSSPPTALSAPAAQSAAETDEDPRQVVMFPSAVRPDVPGATAAPPSPPPPAERPEDLQALWNAEAHPALPRWKELTDTRRRKAAARLRDRPLAEWREVIRRINSSAFCRGEDGKGWRASPDWLLQSETAAKVLEGKYSRPGEQPPEAPSDRPKPRVITM